MSYPLIEPMRADPEEIRDADEDEQMSQISISCGRYYCVAWGVDPEFYEKKLEEAKECLNLPDDYDKPDCEWHIGPESVTFPRHPDYDEDDEDDDNESCYIWLRGNENAFEKDNCDWGWDGISPTDYDLASNECAAPYRRNFVPLGQQIMEEIGHELYEDDFEEDDFEEAEMRKLSMRIQRLLSIEITPAQRKELREKRVEMYQEKCDYYREHGTCRAPDNDGCSNVENCCSFEKIDSCFCEFDKNKYLCILTPCCGHKMHLRCLYAWKETKEEANSSQWETGTIEHCPYCRANWDDYGCGLYPAQ